MEFENILNFVFLGNDNILSFKIGMYIGVLFYCGS